MEAQKLISIQRAEGLLAVICGLVTDYEIDMGRELLACDREEYRQWYGQEPEVQIQKDMRRLRDFTAALQAALDSREASNLLEACNVLRKTASEEIVGLLNEILISDYSGFQAMKTLIGAGRLSEDAYWEDTPALYQLWSLIAKAGWSHGLAAIAQFCEEEAVAV